MGVFRSFFAMCDKAFYFQFKRAMFILMLVMVSSFMYPNNDPSKNYEDYYDGGYTHIRICRDSNTACFYQFDSTRHPVLSDTIRRGKFMITKIFKNFHVLKNVSDINTLWKEMEIKCNISETDKLSVKFDIPRLKGKYLLQIHSIGRDSTFQEKFSNNCTFHFSPDSVGYEFALIPQEHPMSHPPLFLLGFNNTVKFIKLPKIQSAIFKKNNQIEISIPHLEDKVFDFWNLNGTLLKIENDKIKWNGNEFKKQK